MKINQCIKGLDFDPDWSILDIDSRISKVSFWYWVITWFPGCEMWPKSACDFLAPLLLLRNQRFAECILIPRKPNPCSIEFGYVYARKIKREEAAAMEDYWYIYIILLLLETENRFSQEVLRAVSTNAAETNSVSSQAPGHIWELKSSNL